MSTSSLFLLSFELLVFPIPIFGSFAPIKNAKIRMTETRFYKPARVNTPPKPLFSLNRYSVDVTIWLRSSLPKVFSRYARTQVSTALRLGYVRTQINNTSQFSCHLSISLPSISRWTSFASCWETFTLWRPCFTFDKARLMYSSLFKTWSTVVNPSTSVWVALFCKKKGKEKSISHLLNWLTEFFLVVSVNF